MNFYYFLTLMQNVCCLRLTFDMFAFRKWHAIIAFNILTSFHSFSLNNKFDTGKFFLKEGR